VGSSRGLVTLIEGNEVFDVGRDERPPRARRRGQDLVVRKRRQRGIFDHRDDIVASGTELDGNCPAQHLI